MVVQHMYKNWYRDVNWGASSDYEYNGLYDEGNLSSVTFVNTF